MTTQQHHLDKVRVTIDCTLEERANIKMLAALHHMTISEYFLAFAKEELNRAIKIPNKTTLDAHKAAIEDQATSYATMDDFWADMGINRRANP